METGSTDGYHEELILRANERFECIEKLIQSNIAGIAVISIPELVLLKTNPKHIDYLNEPYNRMDQIVGKPLSEIDGPWSNFLNKRNLDCFIETQAASYLHEFKMDMKNGGVKYFNNILSPVEADGEIRYILSILMDVTESVKNREKAEMAARTIQLEKEELEAIIDNLSDAVFIFRNGELYLKNQVSGGYFGDHKIETPEDIYDAASFYDIRGKRLTYEEMPLCRMLRGESILEEDVMMVRNDNTKYLTITGTSLSDKTGRPYLHIMNWRDATDKARNFLAIVEQKKQLDQELEAERYRADVLKLKMQENEAFLSFISHEFRTPLTVINSAIQALEFTCRDELSQKAEKYLNSIRQNSYRLLRLMNNILDLNRAEAGFLKTYSIKTEVISLTRNIVDSVLVYARQKGLEIHFTSRCKTIYAILDQTKYERILLNLLSNAVKFTPPGKSIYVGIASKNGKVYLKVRDEGVGIPREKQKELFKRYSQVSNDLTRPSEGAGIGLSLVKQLVTSMKGEITLKSCEGKGSTFIVKLPAENTQDTDNAAATEIKGDSLKETARIEFS